MLQLQALCRRITPLVVRSSVRCWASSVPSAPKRPPTSYLLWLEANRLRIKSEIGTNKVTEVAKAAGREWRFLSDASKKEYEEQASSLKADYESAVKAFKEQGHELPARKSKKKKVAKKVSSGPKRPATSYMLWLQANRSRITSELGTNKVTEVAKAAGREWKLLSDAAKKPYEEQAATLKAEYQSAMKDFKASQPPPAKKEKKAPAKKAKKVVKPKRPLSAYILWVKDNYSAVRESMGAGTKSTEVMKEAAARWRQLPDHEKTPFVSQSDAMKAAYKKKK